MTITKKLSDIVNTTNESNKTLNSIEFTYWLHEGILKRTTNKPSSFLNVILLSSDNEFDYMICYDIDINDGCLYVGHWNDGIVI